MKSPYIYTHQKARGQGKKPALFLLHGLGSDEHDVMQLVKDVPFDCHIFSLRGPIMHKPGFAFYTFEEEGKPEQRIFDQVVQHTKLFIEEATATFNLDQQELYVVGFNQGAAIAQAVAVVMGQDLRGTIALSGYTPQFVVEQYRKIPLQNVRVFIGHGQYDYVYPVAWAKESASFFEEYGADVTLMIYEDGHGVTEQEIQDIMRWLRS